MPSLGVHFQWGQTDIICIMYKVIYVFKFSNCIFWQLKAFCISLKVKVVYYIEKSKIWKCSARQDRKQAPVCASLLNIFSFASNYTKFVIIMCRTIIVLIWNNINKGILFKWRVSNLIEHICSIIELKLSIRKYIFLVLST